MKKIIFIIILSLSIISGSGISYPYDLFEKQEKENTGNISDKHAIGSIEYPVAAAFSDKSGTE